MKKGHIVLLLAILINHTLSIKLFSLRKKKGPTDKDCDIKVGEKCELFPDGKHNCQEGLQCALFCEKSERGKCQYWCVKKLKAACTKDDECIFEYCDKNNVCSERQSAGSTCERAEQCFSFICNNSICEQPPKDKCLEEPDPEGCTAVPMRPGCPKFCDEYPRHRDCFKPEPSQRCKEDPKAKGCEEFCKKFKDDESCKPKPRPPTPKECQQEKPPQGCPDWCKENPDNIICAPDNCENTPYRPGCPNYCKYKPKDVLCKPTPDDCESNPKKTGCTKWCEEKENRNEPICRPTPDDCQTNPKKEGCPDFCDDEKNKDDDKCKPIPPETCLKNPKKVGCPEYCDENPKDENCVKPTPDDCEKKKALRVGCADNCKKPEFKDHPLCEDPVPGICTLEPQRRGCPGFCEANKDDPSCSEPNPTDCEVDEMREGCPKFCEIMTNWEHPSCKTPTPDNCNKNPMKMGCYKFCLENKSHPLCQIIPTICETLPSYPGCPKFCEINKGDIYCEPTPPPNDCDDNEFKAGCYEFCKRIPSHILCQFKPTTKYDSDNGKEVDDKKEEEQVWEDDDPYTNPKQGELFSSCENDADCNDGIKAEDGTDSTLACQAGKCRLKPGEFCYPGNNYLDYTCYNRNPCMKRWVKREFRVDQIYGVYKRIIEMTSNKQQMMLNKFDMFLGRYEGWGVIDNLNMHIPNNNRESVVTYQCVVNQKMRCTSDEFCASSHCIDLPGQQSKGKKFCTYQDEGDTCEQAFECETHNCEEKEGFKTCMTKKQVDETCMHGFECQNEICIRYRPTMFVQQIKNLIQKYCQKPNMLPLNSLCRKNVECSDQEILNNGDSKQVGQLKCLEANIVNTKKYKEAAIRLMTQFKQNVRPGPKDSIDQNKMDQDLTNQEIQDDYSFNFVFKCKVPNGQPCSADHQCPFNSDCDKQDQVCKGTTGAFCTKQEMCAKGYDCHQDNNVKSPTYRRRICSKKTEE